MADIAPFRGLRYNQQLIPDLDKVVTPPYDVISETEQEHFCCLHPCNMVHLELGKRHCDDSPDNNPHTRAACFLREWQEEKILIREEVPTIYYYEMDFVLEREARTRCGFICLLRLEEFESGRVRPHEKTFAAIKDERLSLMLQCHANLSPIFALYNDAEDAVCTMLKDGCRSDPIIAYVDRNNMAHRVWRVSDENLLKRVRKLMADKAIFIADGHHRYETALNYRAEMRRRYPDVGPDAPFEYVMMYLANMQQDGLCILPTHRLVRCAEEFNTDVLLSGARNYFRVSQYELSETGRSAWSSALRQAGREKRCAIGFYGEGMEGYYLLEARQDAVDRFLGELGIFPVLRNLDVVILDRVLLRGVLGLSEAYLGDPANIRFHHSLQGALAEIEAGSKEWGFFINPTRIDQVQEVAGQGLTMPHKATYFYPKVVSGLVMHPIIADESIVC